MTRSQLLETTAILEWKAITKGSLLGFAKVQFPSGVIFIACGIYTGHGRVWASPAGKPMLRDGVAMRDQDDKIKWEKVVDFASREVRNRWSDTVIAALRRDYPDALPPEQDHAAAVEADFKKRPWA